MCKWKGVVDVSKKQSKKFESSSDLSSWNLVTPWVVKTKPQYTSEILATAKLDSITHFTTSCITTTM